MSLLPPNPLLLDFVRALAKADARRDRLAAAQQMEKTCHHSEQQSTPASQPTFKAKDRSMTKLPSVENSQSEMATSSAKPTSTKRGRGRPSLEEMDYSVLWTMPGLETSTSSSSKR
ncbi:hypothetical protein FHX05_001333 [Rhizobium sp. BK491]|nr:hypothetical protein [Rhizobium sp. BK491]